MTSNDGLWLGFVDECWCDVSLRFPDGSECTVEAAKGRDLRDPRHSDEAMVEETKSSLFYPGQELTGRAAVWRQAVWHKGSKAVPSRYNHTGVVYNVNPVRVLVQWVTGPEQYSDETATEVDLSQTPLSVLSCYEHARMMLGDRVMLSQELMREAMGEEEAKNEESKEAERQRGYNEDAERKAAESAAARAAGQTARVRGGGKERAAATRRQEQRTLSDTSRRCALITRSRTSVSILWQNGVREDNIPSINLLPRTDLIDNDFMPTDYVLVRGSQRLATVLSVNPTDRTCRVRWLDPIADDVTVPFPVEDSEADGSDAAADANALGPRRAGDEAEVSIFDVVAHPHLELSLSSHVVRVPGAEEGDTSIDVPFGTAGQVIGFQEGQLRVQWADADKKVSVVQADQVWNVDQADDGMDGEYEEEGEGYGVDEDGNLIELPEGAELVADEDEDEEDGGGIAGVIGGWISAMTGGRGGAAAGQQRRPRLGGATVEEIQSGEEEEDEEAHEDEEEDDEDDEDDEEDDEDDDDEDDEEDEDEEEEEEEEEEEPAKKKGSAAAKPSATQPSASPPAAPAVHLTSVPSAQSPAAEPSVLSASSEPVMPAVQADTSGHTVLGSTALYSLFFGNKGASSSTPASDSTNTTDARTGTADAATADTTTETKEDESEPAEAGIDLQSLYTRPPTSAQQFASFTVLSNPTTHYFLSTPFPTAPPSSFTKKVRADIRLLRLHLPAGIHVLTYEGRMDLLRAVIVGPRWTPFYSSLFMFDIHLPPTYPAVPPAVHYYSHGLRLHPNLYVEGKVCLSILNTWNGRTTERWQPESTTLHQVLLSLQGLVLGDAEPFYLEAGLERLRGETQSVVSAVQSAISHTRLRTALSRQPANEHITHPMRCCCTVPVTSYRYNETSVLFSLQSDISALQHADPEWLPLLLSHYSAPTVRDVFEKLNQYTKTMKAHTDQPATAQQSEEKVVDEASKEAMKTLFHLFSLPLGKSLLPRGKAAATPASEAKEASSESSAGDEKKSADGAIPAAAAGHPAAMIYMPSVGFLRSLSRDASKMCSQLAKTQTAWEVAVAKAKSEAESEAASS